MTEQQPLNYLPRGVWNSIRAAEIHLRIWMWLFYVVAAGFMIFGIGSDFVILTRVGGTFTQIGVLLLIDTLLICSAAFAFWLLGRRCARARVSLLTGDSMGYQWACYAFSILFSIGTLFMMFCLPIAVTFMFDSGKPTLTAAWVLFGGIIYGMLVWTNFRIARGKEAMDSTAESV